MAALEKEREESLKTKLSAWYWRVADADSVTVYSWETRRYGQRDEGCVCVCLRERDCHGETGRYIDKEREYDM